MIRFNVHAEPYAKDVHVLCPPKDLMEVIHILRKISGIEIAAHESVVRELTENRPSTVDENRG